MSNPAELFECVSQGRLERFHELLSAQGDLAGSRNEQGISLVMWAKYHGREDFVQEALQANPPLDPFEQAALGDAAALEQSLATDPGLISGKSNDGFTLLHLAAFFGHPALVRLLLARGADSNAAADNPSRVRPLHSAAACGNAEIVNQLIEAKADVNARQMGGWTALHAVAKRGLAPIVESLLQAGADKNAKSDDRNDALQLASEAGHSECVELLR